MGSRSTSLEFGAIPHGAHCENLVICDELGTAHYCPDCGEQLVLLSWKVMADSKAREFQGLHLFQRQPENCGLDIGWKSKER